MPGTALSPPAVGPGRGDGVSWLALWPPRDWRMLLALGGLGIAGGGAWLLAMWALEYLADLSVRLNSIWPLAYFSYGTLALLAVPSAGFAVVVGLKSFRLEGPGGTSAEFTGDGSSGPTVTTTTATTVTNGDVSV